MDIRKVEEIRDSKGECEEELSEITDEHIQTVIYEQILDAMVAEKFQEAYDEVLLDKEEQIIVEDIEIAIFVQILEAVTSEKILEIYDASLLRKIEEVVDGREIPHSEFSEREDEKEEVGDVFLEILLSGQPLEIAKIENIRHPEGEGEKGHSVHKSFKCFLK